MSNKLNKIKQYLIQIENISPLRIGSGDEEGNGVLLVDNFAIISGTTVAGLFRRFLLIEKGLSEEDMVYKLIYTSNKDISKIYFYDAFSSEKVSKDDLICRPHIKMDRDLGNALDRHLFDEYHISQGKKFNLTFEIKGLDLEEEVYKDLSSYLEEFISQLAIGTVSIGSKSNFGFGVFKSVEKSNFYCREYDLLKEKELNKYLDTRCIIKDNLYKTDIKEVESSRCKIVFKGYCKDGFIIKGQDKKENKFKIIGKSYSEKINKKDIFIIPSSTIKGIVRNYSYKIYETLIKDTNELEAIFGRGTKEKNETKKGTAIKGKIIFNDCEIDRNKPAEYNRIKIDRFTGGTIDGAIFTDELVTVPKESPIEFTVEMKEENKKAIALVLLTFRDIGLGYVTVGSGNNVGYGRFKGISISINEGKNKNSKVDFNGELLVGDTEEFDKIISTLSR